MDMKIPTFAENGDHIRLGLNKSADVLVLFRSNVRPSGRTKSGNFSLDEFFLLDVLEKRHILRVASRPSTLDIVDSDFIKFVRNADLVLYKE